MAINKYRVVVQHSRTSTVTVESEDTYHAIEKAKKLLFSNNAVPDLESYKTEVKSIEEIKE